MVTLIILAIIFGGPIIYVWCFHLWELNTVDGREHLRERKERESLGAEEKRIEEEFRKIEIAEKIRKAKEEAEARQKAEFERYEDLGREIRSTPKYANWRQAVFEKNGKACERCGSTDGLQVHHIQSFYSILKSCGVENWEDAFACVPLWDVSNGLILCRSCHSQTRASQLRKQLKEKQGLTDAVASQRINLSSPVIKEPEKPENYNQQQGMVDEDSEDVVEPVFTGDWYEEEETEEDDPEMMDSLELSRETGWFYDDFTVDDWLESEGGDVADTSHLESEEV